MEPQMDLTFFTLHFKHSGNHLYLNVLSPNDSSPLLKATVAHTFTSQVAPKGEISGENLFIDWPNQGHLSVMHEDLGEGKHRYNFQYISFKPKQLMDMFDMREAHWFGGCQVMKQKWPLENWNFKLAPYVADDSFKDGKYGGVQERYFFNSKGVSIFVDHFTPLFVAFNEGDSKHMTFVAKFESPYYNNDEFQLKMNYSIFQDRGLKAVHELTSKHMISKPIDHPDEMVFRYPIWSTWAIYKKNINEQVIFDYADKILQEGFKSCQVEIDDDWTPHYGDNVFDSRKFPNPKQMIASLKQKGFRVTLWVHPFASSKADCLKYDFWLSNYQGGYTTWWNGIGKCLDVTNPAAQAWFKESLEKLRKECDIDSFKFDAGEVNWLPSGFSSHSKMVTVNEYPRLYAKMCYEVEPVLRAQEVRVGVRTQDLPIFVRMMDKESIWGYENGLSTLIPHALTFGLIGYPFVLPDMVGGNAYHGIPDRELYIRWLEANALLTCVQISIPPWHYDDEVVRISKKMLELHERFAPLIIQLAKEAVLTGSPIVRPLWWVAPDCETCQTLDSEFLLGNDLLVAPVLTPKMLKRSIYLPPGQWQCQLTKKVLEGGKWYDDYDVKLDELAHFLRV